MPLVDGGPLIVTVRGMGSQLQYVLDHWPFALGIVGLLTFLAVLLFQRAARKAEAELADLDVDEPDTTALLQDEEYVPGVGWQVRQTTTIPEGAAPKAADDTVNEPPQEYTVAPVISQDETPIHPAPTVEAAAPSGPPAPGQPLWAYVPTPEHTYPTSIDATPTIPVTDGTVTAESSEPGTVDNQAAASTDIPGESSSYPLRTQDEAVDAKTAANDADAPEDTPTTAAENDIPATVHDSTDDQAADVDPEGSADEPEPGEDSPDTPTAGDEHPAEAALAAADPQDPAELALEHAPAAPPRRVSVLPANRPPVPDPFPEGFDAPDTETTDNDGAAHDIDFPAAVVGNDTDEQDMATSADEAATSNDSEDPMTELAPTDATPAAKPLPAIDVTFPVAPITVDPDKPLTRRQIREMERRAEAAARLAYLQKRTAPEPTNAGTADDQAENDAATPWWVSPIDTGSDESSDAADTSAHDETGTQTSQEQADCDADQPEQPLAPTWGFPNPSADAEHSDVPTWGSNDETQQAADSEHADALIATPAEEEVVTAEEDTAPKLGWWAARRARKAAKRAEKLRQAEAEFAAAEAAEQTGPTGAWDTPDTWDATDAGTPDPAADHTEPAAQDVDEAMKPQWAPVTEETATVADGQHTAVQPQWAPLTEQPTAPPVEDTTAVPASEYGPKYHPVADQWNAAEVNPDLADTGHQEDEADDDETRDDAGTAADAATLDVGEDWTGADTAHEATDEGTGDVDEEPAVGDAPAWLVAPAPVFPSPADEQDTVDDQPTFEGGYGTADAEHDAPAPAWLTPPVPELPEETATDEAADQDADVPEMAVPAPVAPFGDLPGPESTTLWATDTANDQDAAEDTAQGDTVPAWLTVPEPVDPTQVTADALLQEEGVDPHATAQDTPPLPVPVWPSLTSEVAAAPSGDLENAEATEAEHTDSLTEAPVPAWDTPAGETATDAGDTAPAPAEDAESSPEAATTPAWGAPAWGSNTPAWGTAAEEPATDPAWGPPAGTPTWGGPAEESAPADVAPDEQAAEEPQQSADASETSADAAPGWGVSAWGLATAEEPQADEAPTTPEVEVAEVDPEAQARVGQVQQALRDRDADAEERRAAAAAKAAAAAAEREERERAKRAEELRKEAERRAKREAAEREAARKRALKLERAAAKAKAKADRKAARAARRTPANAPDSEGTAALRAAAAAMLAQAQQEATEPPAPDFGAAGTVEIPAMPAVAKEPAPDAETTAYAIGASRRAHADVDHTAYDLPEPLPRALGTPQN